MDDHRALPEEGRKARCARDRYAPSHFRDNPSLVDAGRVAVMVARAGAHTAFDKIRRAPVWERTQVPARIQDVTEEWLTAVLCGPHRDALVTGVSVGTTPRP
jgi:hypothetical protein